MIRLYPYVKIEATAKGLYAVCPECQIPVVLRHKKSGSMNAHFDKEHPEAVQVIK